MFDPKKFTTTTAKPLPVILLLDISISMSGDNIDNLNDAVKKMISTFSEEEKMETEILVSVITFGGEVSLHIPFTKASNIEWLPLVVSGATPMGTALRMAKAMIEDKETTPSRAYRPTIILVSDGQPTDDWETPLNDFISEGRSSKCDRMSMAIGSGAEKKVLKRFIKDTDHELFTSDGAGQIHEFFQRVTMSVTMRTQSKNPNDIPASISIEENFSNINMANNDPLLNNGQDKGYW